MSSNTFKKKIEQELKKLNRKQSVNFAWRCAVRALPFLGSKGSFNFWDKGVRQKHLYAIFYALDTNADADATTITRAVRAAAAYANVSRIDLESIILQDLRTIQGKDGPHISTEFYGKIWEDFQKALEAEGCAYWGKLYKSIFDNEFVLDQEALARRMNVPKEIREQGATAVANFLEEMEEKGAVRLNEARIIILGDKGAGKTSLARRLIDPNAPMATDDESTAGVDTMLWKLEHESINVSIWDFAGHTVTHAVHQFFLSERCLYIMVYDGRAEERNRLEYWLDHMKNYGGDSKAIILVNKRDPHPVDIPINSLKEQYYIEKDYTFSIKDDRAVLDLFRKDVAGYIKNNPSWNKQEIPKNYFQVKEDLELLFTNRKDVKGKEHITKEQFKKIANKVDDIEKLLNTDFHSYRNRHNRYLIIPPSVWHTIVFVKYYSF